LKGNQLKDKRRFGDPAARTCLHTTGSTKRTRYKGQKGTEMSNTSPGFIKSGNMSPKKNPVSMWGGGWQEESTKMQRKFQRLRRPSTALKKGVKKTM